MTQRYQVVVVGGGLVGASAALALSRHGLRVALIERRPAAPLSVDWDRRVYAISPASTRFLQSLGAWDRLDRDRTQSVFRMDVGGDAGGQVRLDAYAAGVPRLATIVESGRLHRALWQALLDDGGVTLLCPETLDTLQRAGGMIAVQLGSGEAIETELLIGADGGASRVREWAGLGGVVTPYEQVGVVANFECSVPHRGTAFQWFRDDDILAWLPLAGNRMSMVWAIPTARGAALLALPAAELAACVQDAGRDRLGTLHPLTPAASFPLALLRVGTPVAPGVALIGDAAHGVHPLAGQGVNLGFGDAEVLSRVLAAQHRRASCGDVRLLERYARERVEPVWRMQAVTHGLHQLFADARAGSLRNLGMQAVDRIAPLKAALVREAMS